MSSDPDEDSGSDWFPIILAVVISVIVVYLVMPNSRRHALSMDEATPPAATETAPAQPTTKP
jgi:hypothetical protein